MVDNNSNNNIPEEFFQSLNELNPQELENVFKVIQDFSYYNEVYNTLTTYILVKYPFLDIDKIAKAGYIIDDILSGMGFGERLIIYNKLDDPFINQIWIEYKEFLQPGKRTPLKEINDMILALHPNINMNKIKNSTEEIEIMVDSLNLNNEEKFLLFNNLAHAYLKDLIGYIRI